MDQEGNFISKSCVYDLINSDSQTQMLAFGGAYEYYSAEKTEKVAIYMGFYNSQWGHFLLDVVQRSWFLIAYDILNDEIKSSYFAD